MHLEIHQDGELVLSYKLSRTRVTVGRSDACDIALPSDTVSRSHCALERVGDVWWLVNQSRHGTRSAAEVVQDRARFLVGEQFGVGVYTLSLRPQHAADPAQETRVFSLARHEQLVAVADGSVAAQRAKLVVVEGPKAGVTAPLSRARTYLGGPRAHVVLDEELPQDALILRVVRGRALVEPGSRPAYLSGQRVREPTPMWPGESLRVGDHVVVVETEWVETGDQPDRFGDLVGSTPVMRALFGTLERASRHDASLLLVGESGTGKELAARAVHASGPRADGAFEPINCAAIPPNLVESELFGHERGAFTGAERKVDGAFQRADGGTLFLDELGEMSLDVQAKLLRTLESGEVRRVGAARPEFPDVRVIAATHRDLPARVREGAFREDLFYRLAVLTVRLPPLRERRADITALAECLLRHDHPGACLGPGVATRLSTYEWPGNVRELRNVLTRAVVLHGDLVTSESISFHPWSFDGAAAPGAWTLRDAERDRIDAALAAHNGNRTRAARELGIPRTSLLYKMEKLGLT